MSEDARKFIVEPEAWVFLTDLGVAERLRQRGWNIEPRALIGAQSGAPAVVAIRFARPAATSARSDHGLAELTLGPSLIAGHLRMGITPFGAKTGQDFHLHQLVTTVGRTLDDDAIAQALSLYPPHDDTISAPGPFGLASGMSDDAVSALQASGHFGPDARNARANAVAVDGAGPALWRALSEGDETICIGASPLARLGLTHDAPTLADIPDAVISHKEELANHRDQTRRALATEILFNSVPVDDPDAVAALIHKGLTALVRPQPPSVSIVITNYNYGRYVDTAIKSALGQTVPAVDVVVVDDGSTDGSRQVIAAMPGIVPVLQSNGGQAAAFNAGFAQAKGDVVLFLDADDCLLPTAIERIVTCDFSGVSRLFFPLQTIDQHGRATGLYAPGTCAAPAAAGFLAGAVATHGIFPFVPTSGNVFPRWVLERLLPMPEADWRICADLWLVLAAATIGEAKELPELLGQYRVHGRNAHFRELGAARHMQVINVMRRRVAWEGLLTRLPDGVPSHVGRVLQIGLLRCLTSASAQVGRSDAVLQIPNAVKRSLAARHLPVSVRCKQVLSAARLAIAGQTDRLIEINSRQAGSLLECALPSGWPRLVPGERKPISVHSPSRSVLGHGWTPEGTGARLVQTLASLAFRLPDLSCNWRLRLAMEVEGPDPVRSILISLNGTVIDEFELAQFGELDLRLPRELLVRWGDVLGAGAPGTAHQNPVAVGDEGQPAGCLTLRVTAADVGRLRLVSMQADVLTTMRPHAPSLAPGRFLRLSKGAADAHSLACLQSGWGWPDPHGVPLTQACSRLSMSVAGEGTHALTLVLSGGADQPRPADCVMPSLNGALVPGHPSPDGRQLTIEVPEHAAFADGRIRIELMVFADPDTGTWPQLWLSGLRLDPARHPGGTSHHGPSLLPNVVCPAGTLLASMVDGVSGLVIDGDLARLTGTRFRVPLVMPDNRGDARLHLSVSAPDPVLACFSLGGPRAEALLSGENTVSLPVPSDLSGDAFLDVEVGDPTRRFVLHSVRLCLVAPRPMSGQKGDISQEAQEGFRDGLGPQDLIRLAEVRSDWHAPLEDALWLSAQQAALTMPPLPPGTVALLVTVLPIHDLGQRLRVEISSSVAETEGPGPQTLRLVIDPSWSDIRLVFNSNRLVASRAVNAGDVGMLGGAIVRIEPEIDIARFEPATLPNQPRMQEKPHAPNKASGKNSELT